MNVTKKCVGKGGLPAALLGPGDICIMDRDCHKSHHYGVIMCGALPAFLDAYPLHEYAPGRWGASIWSC